MTGILALVSIFVFVFVLVELCRRAIEREASRIDKRIRMKQTVSDEEFIAACSSQKPEIALRIRAIIADQLDVPEQYLQPDDRFVEDLRAD